MKLLSIPSDFAHRDEVKLLALEMINRFHCGAEVAQMVACQIVFLLWLDWARSGKPHRPFAGRTEQVERLITLAVGGPFLAAMLGVVAPDVDSVSFSVIGILCDSGVLTQQDDGGDAGYTLTGFAEYNAHLHPDYKSMQSQGGIAKRRNARLRQAANDGAKQRTLLQQSGFAFPSEEPATEKEQNEAIGYILQLHMAMDLPVPSMADWSQSLVRDAIHIVRAFPSERLMEIAAWIMENRSGLDGQDPEWFIRNFSTFEPTVPKP